MRRTRQRRSCTKRLGRMKSGFVCTVATLAEAAEQENIKKTALIIVGDVTAQAGTSAHVYMRQNSQLNSVRGRMDFVYE